MKFVTDGKASIPDKRDSPRATLSRSRVMTRHALRNALIPLVTVVAIDIGAVFGGAVGLTLAFWGLDVLNHFIPHQAVNRVDRFQVNGQVLGYTASISLLAGILFGIAPGIQSCKQSFSNSLKEGATHLTTSGKTGYLRHLLVVSEISLAMVLLLGAGLLIESSWHLQGLYRGLDVNNVLTMQIWLPQAKYGASHQIVNFFRQVLQRIEALPGVESASAINFPMLEVPG